MRTRSESKWLGVIVALQIATIIGLWANSPGPSPAMAQVPDAGAQQQQIIDQLKSVNEKLDKLVTLLDGGNLQVKVAKSDESKGH